MGPTGVSRKREIITVVTVLVVIVFIVTATVIAKKKESNDVAADTSATTSTTADSSATDASAATNLSSYKDGSYTATGVYQSPGGTQKISVKVTLANGVVTDSTVTDAASDNESAEYQSMFISGYKQYVTGKSIDAISLSRVSGSSLTSQGFNDAIDQIQDQAKA